MGKGYYLAFDDAGKLRLMVNMDARLPLYLDELELSPADLAEHKADTAVFQYLNNRTAQAQSYAHEAVAYRNSMRDGGSDAGSGAYPPALVLDTPPPPVAPGIVPRLTGRIARIKAARNYTEAIGQDLGIVGPHSVVDPSSWQPQLDVRLVSGQPMVAWTKGQADSLEVWVAHGPESNFERLEVTTDPHFVDPSALPAQPVQWRYKAIYRLHDAQVGSWSTISTLAVGG